MNFASTRWLALTIVWAAACAPAQPVPSVVHTESPTEAFVRYWEARLEQGPDDATWRDLCAALERWPGLQPRHVGRLDAAMAEWPDEMRRPPDRWEPIDAPIRLPVWPLIRAIDVGPADAAALAEPLPHLGTVSVATVAGSPTVAALADSDALPKLIDLRLSGADITAVAAVVARRGDTLVALDLWENNLGPRLGDVLKSRTWGNLERLDIGANKLDAAAAQQIGAIEAPRLHTLGVSFNAIGDDGFAALTAARFDLIELDARATKTGTASVKALAQLDLNRLEALDLSDNALGDDAITDLARLPLGRLQALRLNHVDLTKRGVLSLTAVLGGGLRVLELGRNELGDDGVAPLCTPGASGLRFLQLDSVRLTNASARSIGRCPHLDELESLSLHANGNLDAAGMKELADAPFGQLTALGLDNCSIRDDGLAALVQASWWPQLTHLRIEANGFTDAAAPTLAKLPEHVENLGLGWNELGTASAEQLAALPLTRLRVLSLRGSAFDDDALRALAEASWLNHLDELDLRALPYDGLGPALDSVAAQLPEHAMLRREQ